MARRSRRAIEVVGARTHNLQGVSCRIPFGKVTVISGPSGAGKSSLAFDTIHAEGQRRFVESMSTYARQFLERLERPPVEEIRNVLASVALEARNTIRGARSTVGTLTEALDVLRKLFAQFGLAACPAGHGPLRAWTSREAASELMSGVVGSRMILWVAVERPPVEADRKLAELLRLGFTRRLEGNQILPLEIASGWREEWNPLRLVLGRYRADKEAEARVALAIEEGWRLTHNGVEVLGESGDRRYFPERTCPVCGFTARPLSPALFSFNLPLGACPTCQGFGRVIGIDRDRVLPDRELSLSQRPIAPWNTPAYEEFYRPLERAARRRGLDLERPLREWSPEDLEWLWSGAGPFVNLNSFFADLEARSYKVHLRVLLARYRSYETCPDCGGARLNGEARTVKWREWTLPELCSMSIDRLRRSLRASRRQGVLRPGEEALFGELEERLDVLHRVGLDYLTLDRPARTLSGGETQRIHLAAALGAGLTRTLYVLDEPTVGLHARDGAKLLALLKTLARRGNTVLVVEHDPSFIRGADWLIDLGPGGGKEGGRLMAEGSVSKVRATEGSPTGLVLRRGLHLTAREHLARYRRERSRASQAEAWTPWGPWIEIRGARAHNLRGIDLRFPLGAMVAIVGVSGSGKSSLLEEVLHAAYLRSRGEPGREPPPWRAVQGLEQLEEMILVDQSPLGRSTRSNPATYVRAYDDLRRIFAGTEAARRRRIGPSHFSFNRDEGRCPDCQGAGTVEVDMQFLAPVTVVCDRCGGSRFRPEILAVRHRGLDIAQTLELTVEEALEHFREETALCRKLVPLVEAGLGYLRLGQATTTLSGGEAQRLKLASFLADLPGRGRHLYLLDEPTTGLHPLDVDRLHGTLRRLTERGDGVVVVEHHLALIGRADWIVELGPGGGEHGGELLFCGPKLEFLESAATPTAGELRRSLAWRRPDTRGSRNADQKVPDPSRKRAEGDRRKLASGR